MYNELEMKTITVTLPTSPKEIKENLKQFFKFVKAPKRAKHNQRIFLELEKEICEILNNGYWSNDISQTMRKSLTCGLPNGVINRLVWKMYRKLK